MERSQPGAERRPDASSPDGGGRPGLRLAMPLAGCSCLPPTAPATTREACLSSKALSHPLLIIPGKGLAFVQGRICLILLCQTKWCQAKGNTSQLLSL